MKKHRKLNLRKISIAKLEEKIAIYGGGTTELGTHFNCEKTIDDNKCFGTKTRTMCEEDSCASFCIHNC